MDSKLYIPNGNVLVGGTPDEISVHLKTPIHVKGVVSYLASHENYLDKYGQALRYLDHYRNIDKVGINDVNTVTKTFENFIPDSVNVRSFTTKPTQNNYETFMSLLHKQTEGLSSINHSVEALKNLHYSCYADVNVFMVMGYYLDSVERWLPTAPDMYDALQPSDAVIDAINHISQDGSADETSALGMMTDSYFTNSYTSMGMSVKNKLRNTFETTGDDSYSVQRSHEHVVALKKDLPALLSVYKHWYDLSGTIAAIK